MKKHIIITKLFDTGGSNSHLKLLIKYFDGNNVILVLEDRDQLIHLKNLFPKEKLSVKIMPNLHRYAHLQYAWSTNIREFFNMVRSTITVLLLSVKHNFADLTISSVEPEKYLYLLWLPFIRVVYILHTEPTKAYTPVTPFTCNHRLGKGKIIITVSKHMHEVISRQWSIKKHIQQFVLVIHNSLIERDLTNQPYPGKNNFSKVILTIGRVEPNKNPKIWLQVAQTITANRRDVNFIWLGNGPDLDYFTNLASAENHINFEGLVTNPQPYFEKAHLYYQPSFNETHGIAVLEAMYNKLPCVVSDAGGLRESVTNNYNGYLVHPTDVKHHVKAISEILDNSEKCKIFGQNSFKKYWESFAYSNFKKQMDGIYTI